jgi:hypothetical protein
MHKGGKIEVNAKLPLKTRDDLSMAYTPGVARVSMAIHEDPAKAWALTIKGNTVAVVSDGTAVLGLGDIGPAAAMPVMEGKAMLFKEFAGVDAFPLCIDTKDVDEIVAFVTAVAPTFGGINLEDIAAPRCFEIERRLRAQLDIPVFHDDKAAVLVDFLRPPRLEVMPLDGVEQDLIAHVPPGLTLTVTSSPTRGVEATVALSERLAAHGYRVVPHLAARLVSDRAHLRELLARLGDVGARGVRRRRRHRAAGGWVRGRRGALSNIDWIVVSSLMKA